MKYFAFQLHSVLTCPSCGLKTVTAVLLTLEGCVYVYMKWTFFYATFLSISLMLCATFDGNLVTPQVKNVAFLSVERVHGFKQCSLFL